MMAHDGQQNLHEACCRFLQQVLLMEAGESVLIYTDSGSDAGLVAALQESAQGLGMQADLLALEGFSDLLAQIQALRDKIESGDYPVICELSARYFYPSSIWEDAVRNGRRVYSAGPLDAVSFLRCVGLVDQGKIMEFGELLEQVISRAQWVHISTPAGTDLTCRMQPIGVFEKLLCSLKEGSLTDRALAKFGLGQRSIVWSPSGVLKKRAGATFLGGQLAFRAIPHTLRGTAVIDGYQWPPTDLGKLEVPLILQVKRGRVVDIDGCPLASLRMKQWLGDRDKTIEHFCIGFNPGAGLSGSLIEAERAFGHINLGFGKYPHHTDGVMTHPVLRLDETLVLENHSFIHPDLAALERQLR
jgi:2,5-dihydroxypyridine 5,6-dioxygenase